MNTLAYERQSIVLGEFSGEKTELFSLEVVADSDRIWTKLLSSDAKRTAIVNDESVEDSWKQS